MIAGLPIGKVSERLDFAKVLLYGPSGVGKTKVAGSVAEVATMLPALFIDVEGGVKTIRNLYPDIDYVRVEDKITSDGKVVSSGWNDVVRIVESGDLVKNYRTVVVDSLTELNKGIMKMVNYNAYLENPSKVDLDVPSKRDWGKGGERTRWLIRTLRDMPIHVIFTALDANERGEGGEPTGNIQPQLPGQLGQQIPAFMDEVFYLYAKKVFNDKMEERIGYFLLSRRDGTHVAKDRSGRMPTVIENPTMKEIVTFVLDAPGGDGQVATSKIAQPATT